MNYCLVNVEYSSGGHLAFLKKVSFAGFTIENKLFTKEITYKYPNTSNTSNTEQTGQRCGNLELKRLDEDLIKTLAKFTTIFVRGTTTRDFINNFATSHTKVIDAESNICCEQE